MNEFELKMLPNIGIFPPLDKDLKKSISRLGDSDVSTVLETVSNWTKEALIKTRMDEENMKSFRVG